jgi:hypothetical protein
MVSAGFVPRQMESLFPNSSSRDFFVFGFPRKARSRDNRGTKFLRLVGFTAGVLLLVLSDTGSAIQDKPEIRVATFHPSGSFRLPDQAFKCEDVCSRTNFAQQLPGRGPPTSAKAGQAKKEQHHLAPLHHRDR